MADYADARMANLQENFLDCLKELEKYVSGLSSTLKKIKELLEDPPRPKVPFEPLGGLVQLLKKNKDVVKSLRLRLSNVQTPEEGCELKARLEEQEAHVKALELTYATALANACRRNPEQTGSTWGWM